MYYNKIIRKIVSRIKNKNILTYGEDLSANYKVSRIKYKVDFSIFDLEYKDINKQNKIIKNIKLRLLGNHNVLNAAAAIAVCLNLGVNQNVVKKSLKDFLEFKGE